VLVRVVLTWVDVEDKNISEKKFAAVEPIKTIKWSLVKNPKLVKKILSTKQMI
jgi:hypothetical protein